MSARDRGEGPYSEASLSKLVSSYISLGSPKAGRLPAWSRVGGRKETMRPPGSTSCRHGAAAATLLLLVLLQLAAVRAQRTTTDPTEGELARSFLE